MMDVSFFPLCAAVMGNVSGAEALTQKALWVDGMVGEKKGL